MSYYFAKTLNVPFDQAVEIAIAALKQRGFGVLTRIDVKSTLKEKLDVEWLIKHSRQKTRSAQCCRVTLSSKNWMGKAKSPQ